MLGHDLEIAFHGDDFIALGREELDIRDSEKLKETFFSIQPDVVVNATGYTDVDKSEEEEDKASEINGYAVGALARACREIDATLVHFSTDYVFSGTKKEGYNEEDTPEPMNAYGRSKLVGEELLIEEMELLDEEFPIEGKYFLIRTSWLFGHNGDNFVAKMLNLAKTKKEIRVVDDQFAKPTFSLDLARQARWLVASNEYPSGIYHITNEPETTWYKFAKKVFELAKIDVNIIPCSSEEFKTKAKRPKYSSLLNNKLPNLRFYEEALKEYLETL